jgi:hypothetical protein
MAEVLFITPLEMTSNTVLSGNTDTDKYLFCIANVQLTTIEPLLGTELYDKIVTDVTNDDLAGLYLELYTDFIKPITKHEALAQYIEIASYIVDNGGIYKRSGENVEVVDKNEVQFLAGKYKTMAQMYVQRFNKWICKNPLTEYKTVQDEVNALKNINLNVGWHL